MVFDAGYTLFSEERLWRDWAAWLGTEYEELMAELAKAIEERRDHVSALAAIKPGFDLHEERRRRAAATGYAEVHTESDLYPDALPTIRQLKHHGYLIGVAGNQPRGSTDILHRVEPNIDFIGSSTEWGATKPGRAFFEHVVAECAMPPDRIAYVGDRLDNDVLPAIELGMLGVLLRRGPWGNVHRKWPEAEKASAQIDALDELPDLLPGLLSRE